VLLYGRAAVEADATRLRAGSGSAMPTAPPAARAEVQGRGREVRAAALAWLRARPPVHLGARRCLRCCTVGAR
jgi:aryl-alcohol dehydrogenase-like predicted oxidoreductase